VAFVSRDGVLSTAGCVMTLKVLQFLALVLVALALIPAGAHFFELPNKIGLAQDQYFIVQGIYRGWALFGIVLFGALATTLALTIVLRHDPAYWFALAAFLCIAATLVIFFVWTYPANVATSNWTAVPANREDLRRHWEYAHAANAVLTFAALCLLVISIIARTTDPRGRAHL
jgi:hypothetical protein